MKKKREKKKKKKKKKTKKRVIPNKCEEKQPRIIKKNVSL
jgi:hypothetical protein